MFYLFRVVLVVVPAVGHTDWHFHVVDHFLAELQLNVAHTPPEPEFV